jgi:aspartate/methionine/tyrosine aminotransferase
MGASEGLLVAVASMINPGDEVVVIDPAYDIYVPQIEMMGGIAKRVSLLPSDDHLSPWKIDFERLEQAFNSKTRVFYYNTPNNPIGKVFTEEELQRLAELLNKWPNVAIVADEVYEHITFDGRKHLSLCDFGNLWERTVTLSSAGKIFSITGWKTGWAVGGQEVIRKMVTAKIWTSFCSNTVCSGAIARGLQIADREYKGFENYYKWLQHQYFNKREIMKRILSNSKVINVQPLLSEGGFFLCGKILDSGSFIPSKYRENATLDFAFSRWITETFKVTCIPCSVFFSSENQHLGADLVRFALCKDYPEYEKTEKILIG